MIKLELPAKMLRFVIEAAEERITSFANQLADIAISDDEFADIGNDRMVLICALDYLKQQEKVWGEKP